MLLCTIVENGANASFCRESGECRDYALFLSFFTQKFTQKNQILAEFWQKFCLKNWPLEALPHVYLGPIKIHKASFSDSDLSVKSDN